MKTLTNEQFMALSNTDQVSFFKEGGKLIADTAATSVGIPTSDVEDIFAHAPVSAPVVTSDFDVVGDAVYMNINVDILGQSFRLKSVKLTEKRQCMDGWDKEAKTWKDDNADVMSLIEMVREHGSNLVNEHVESTVRFGKAGEKNTAKRDPLAALLKAQATTL